MLVVGPAAVTRHVSPSFTTDRTAVIEHRAAQVDRRLVLHQVEWTASRPVTSGPDSMDDVADLERADAALGERRLERRLRARCA
jgi:hypothetical protein